MARKIKRLNDEWDSRDIHDMIQLDESTAWRDELAWWRHAGVSPGTILGILEHTRIQRLRHEGQLRDRVTRDSTRNIRWIRKAWKDAAPLIHFFNTEKAPDDGDSPGLLFGDLGEQIDGAVRNYISARLPRSIPRGRQGDLWLYRCVCFLAVCLMSDALAESGSRRLVRQSEKSTIRAIERVLKLAGHGDVVTKEKIRHTIRAIRPSLRGNHKSGSAHQKRARRKRSWQEG